MKIIFDQTSDLHIKHPITDEPLYLTDADGKPIKDKPMIAKIYGKHTSEYKNAISSLMKKRSGKKNLSLEESNNQNNELLAACVAGFKNLDIETEYGKLDPKNVVECFEKAFWLRDQVDSAVVDLENFMQAP